jgi:hypothetical protein
MTAPILIDVERRFPVSVHDGFDYITDPGHWPEYWPGLVRRFRERSSSFRAENDTGPVAGPAPARRRVDP